MRAVAPRPVRPPARVSVSGWSTRYKACDSIHTQPLILASAFTRFALPRSWSVIMSTGSLLPRCLSAPVRTVGRHRAWTLPQVGMHGNCCRCRASTSAWLTAVSLDHSRAELSCSPVHAGCEAAFRLGNSVGSTQQEQCRARKTAAGRHQLLSTHTCVSTAFSLGLRQYEMLARGCDIMQQSRRFDPL